MLLISRSSRRYSYLSPSAREIPSVPSTNASASSHASPTTYDVSSCRRQDRRSARSADYRKPRSAIAIAGTVPGPWSFGSRHPCSGGSSPAARLRGARAHTSQSASGGTANATATSATARPIPTNGAPAQGARARVVGIRPTVGAGCPAPSRQAGPSPLRKFSSRSR